MPRRGPHLITALPEDLSGITTELAVALHRAAMAHGRQIDPQQKLLVVMAPLPICILATTLPDQMRLAVSSGSAPFCVDTAVMIFITADSHNYLLLDTTLDVTDLVTIAATLGADDP